ncbi:MAG TPA: hypothetical protein ENH19_02065 [Actinobacteria bacterium]|nr:hypothetical protein [Actinomycetes bacterium]HEX21422.1 hypothetical protein [Actinomycetota bacterium]
MTWLRWDAEYDVHPDIIIVGWEAAVTFERVCRIVKKFNMRSGRIKEKYLTADYIHKTTSVPKEIIKIGLDNCLKGDEPLIAKDEDGYYIPGWSNYQIDPTNADRQAKFKKRKKQKKVTEVTVSNGSNDDSTGQYGKERASTLSTYRSEPVENSKEAKNAADSNESKSKNNSKADVEDTAVGKGNGKAESKHTSVIADKIIRSVTTQAEVELKSRDYWNESKACEERLGRFVSKLGTEASIKKNPAAWLVKVAKIRLIENLDDFKPPREEMEKAT